ncbi:hypothetical protein [Alkalisalibacterium limincola]|uniref:DUF2459 domain-containing protein n=1 Tax=Alkalisalibacterium limincola TaxID=2699169 RepID=A0A5C8KM85_9GAMM|nr:hypothetical protein [Alkalisalibacterium limincola]TXK60986.1 hypothetical protein FU658_10420 [Alkalisalibacterium limincola]
MLGRGTAAVLLVLLALLAAGCSARLVPPQQPPPEPRQVVLLEHGRHASLVLFDAEQVPWRFAYGDRRWYLENIRGPGPAASALFSDSPAVLGRRALDSPDPAHWQAQVGSLITATVPFQVDAGRVDALLDTLHGVFASAGDVVPAPHLGLEVTAHPQPYRLGHNSNHVVAQWLQALDVQVQGNPAIGRWRTQH